MKYTEEQWKLMQQRFNEMTPFKQIETIYKHKELFEVESIGEWLKVSPKGLKMSFEVKQGKDKEQIKSIIKIWRLVK